MSSLSVLIVLAHVDDTKLFWHLLPQSLTKLVCARSRHRRIGVKIQRDVGGISALSSANVDGDDAFVIGVELEVKDILKGVVLVQFYLMKMRMREMEYLQVLWFLFLYCSNS